MKLFLLGMRCVVPLAALSLLGVAHAQGETETIPLVKREIVRPLPPIDTSTFFPQIAPASSERPKIVKPPLYTPWQNLQSGGEAKPIGSLLDEQRSTPTAQFPGIGFTTWRPPDPSLAVGRTHVVQVVNMSLAIFTKSGTKQFEQTNQLFFAGYADTNFIFDPKVIYDRHAQRFIIMVPEFDSGSRVSNILLAVSDDEDPNGTWFRYKVDVEQNNTFWLDYPGYGYNRDAWAVSGNMFGYSGGFNGAQFIVIRKSLNNEPLTVFRFNDTAGSSVQIADTINSNVDRIFAISAQTDTTAKLYALTNLTGTPVLNSSFVTVPTFSRPSVDAPSTNGRTLDTIDGRIINTMFRDGKLLATHTVDTTADTTNRVRWYEFNTNNWPTSGSVTLAQSGDIFGGAGTHFHMSSIARNALGDTSVIFTRSNATQFTADVMIASRRANDPLGTMGQPQRLDQSTTTSYGLAGNNRWGDYFMVVVDPVDDVTFWGTSMTGATGDQWRTGIYSWTVSQPPQRVNPTAFTVNRGRLVSGTLNDLFTSNDVRLQIANGAIALPSESPITVTVNAVAPASTAALFRFTLESRASIAGLTQAVDFFDYLANAFETIDTRNAPTTDTTVVAERTTNTARFIQVNSRAIQTRLRWRPAGPLFTNSWQSGTDLAVWDIAP